MPVQQSVQGVQGQAYIPTRSWSHLGPRRLRPWCDVRRLHVSGSLRCALPDRFTSRQALNGGSKYSLTLRDVCLHLTAPTGEVQGAIARLRGVVLIHCPLRCSAAGDGVGVRWQPCDRVRSVPWLPIVRTVSVSERLVCCVRYSWSGRCADWAFDCWWLRCAGRAGCVCCWAYAALFL